MPCSTHSTHTHSLFDLLHHLSALCAPFDVLAKGRKGGREGEGGKSASVSGTKCEADWAGCDSCIVAWTTGHTQLGSVCACRACVCVFRY